MQKIASTDDKVWVTPPEDQRMIDHAKRRGLPTHAFKAKPLRGAPWMFWSRVQLDDGSILDLPPMYNLTAI